MATDVHSSEEHTHEESPKGNALPNSVHLAVPIGSILMLILVAFTTANPGEITTLFIPIFLFMVVVYVLASMYLFKQIVDKDRSTIGAEETPAHGGH